MKVLVAHSDEGGCGHYRMIYPGQACARYGQVEVRFDQNLPIHRTITQHQEVTGVGDLEAHVLVIQRPVSRVVTQSIPFWQKKGIAVVVDIDDDFSCLNPQNQAWALYHPKNDPEFNWDWLKKAAGMADMVTCATHALVDRYGGRGNAIYMPNCVPEAHLSNPSRGNGRTVGWAGFSTMHRGDLEVTHGGVAAAVRTGECDFLCVGNGLEVGKALALDTEDAPATGARNFRDYAYALGQLDVGLVPLADTRFNQGKSYLKGLEYAAAGVPFVASPVPSYSELWNTGLGHLASNRGKDWKRAILSLIRDDARREYEAEAGRDLIKEQFTYEGQWERWADAWDMAREIRVRRNLVRA